MKKTLMFVLMMTLCLGFTACDEGGSSVSSKNTVDWPANFYGEEIPAPDGYTKAAEISEDTTMSGDVVTTVRIDGLTYEQYKAYCKKLSGLSGWISDDANAALPETTTEKGTFDFRGTLNALPRVTASYFGAESPRVKEGSTFVFAMFIYQTYN